MAHAQPKSTGFGLAAFFATIGLLAYRANLRNRLQVIKTTPENSRSNIITSELNSFGIDATKLTLQQQVDIAIKELELREKRMFYTSNVTIVTVIVCGIVSIVAFATSSKSGQSSTSNLIVGYTSPNTIGRAEQPCVSDNGTEIQEYGEFFSPFGKYFTEVNVEEAVKTINYGPTPMIGCHEVNKYYTNEPDSVKKLVGIRVYAHADCGSGLEPVLKGWKITAVCRVSGKLGDLSTKQ